jgi:hypothetical protein
MIVPLLWFWSILLHFAYMALVLLVISEVVVFVFSLCIWPYFILAGEGCSGNKQNVRNDTKPPTESKVTSHNWRRKDKNKVSAHNRLPVRKTVKLPQWWCLFQILESLSKQTTTTITTRRTRRTRKIQRARRTTKKNNKEEQHRKKKTKKKNNSPDSSSHHKSIESSTLKVKTHKSLQQLYEGHTAAARNIRLASTWLTTDNIYSQFFTLLLRCVLLLLTSCLSVIPRWNIYTVNHSYIYIKLQSIWRFSKMGVPLNHSFYWDLPL